MSERPGSEPPFRIVQPDEHYRRRTRREQRLERSMIAIVVFVALLVFGFAGLLVYLLT